MDTTKMDDTELPAGIGAIKVHKNMLSRLSVVRKMALLGALAVTIGIVGLVALGVSNQRTVLMAQGESSFQAMTQLLAKNVTGGIRWGKAEAVTLAYQDFAGADDSAIANIITLSQRVPCGFPATHCAEGIPPEKIHQVVMIGRS